MAAAVAAPCWTGCPALRAQAPAGEDFPGVKGVLTPQQFSAAGLDKLSPEERAKLDGALRDYFSGATRRVADQAASQAVSQAVKEKRVQPPTLIESRLVGTFSGWKETTVFILENGEHWKVTDGSSGHYAPVANPPVLVVRDVFGFKMAISGGGIMRVRKL